MAQFLRYFEPHTMRMFRSYHRRANSSVGINFNAIFLNSLKHLKNSGELTIALSRLISESRMAGRQLEARVLEILLSFSL